MRQLCEAYGFRFAPAHAFNPEETDHLQKKPDSRATFAARRGASTGRMQWSAAQSRSYAERISEDLDAASTFDDIAERFAADGLKLEAKGKGFVVGDGASYTKLSALGFQISANGLARRRPLRRAPPRRAPPSLPQSSGRLQSPPRAAPAWPLVDAVDITKAFATMGLADGADVRAAVLEARGRRLAHLSRKPLIEQLLADLKDELAGWTGLSPPGKRRQAVRRRPPKRGQGEKQQQPPPAKSQLR